MSQTSRDLFEQAYADHTFEPVERIRDFRMCNGSYSLPKLASAWHWWKKSREVAHEPA